MGGTFDKSAADVYVMKPRLLFYGLIRRGAAMRTGVEGCSGAQVQSREQILLRRG